MPIDELPCRDNTFPDSMWTNAHPLPVFSWALVSQGLYGGAISLSQFFKREFVFADKTTTPKAINDVKLIHAGKILEDSKTLADSRITIGDLPAGVITMHVVVQPPATKKKTGICSLSFIKHVG